MTRIHFQDESTTLHQGDSLEVARTLESGSVDCIVTSPPYYGLRDYGTEGQYGLEASPAEYVETMRALFSELRRVLVDDGTLWLNLGDSYSSKAKGASGGAARSTLTTSGRGKVNTHANQDFTPRAINAGVPDKNLMGIPWRVAFALQEDGWILRNAIVWNKPNAMPESVTDRLSTRYEMVYMFSKKPRYRFDLDLIREPLEHPDAGFKERNTTYTADMKARRSEVRGIKADIGKNPGDVWTIATQPFGGAHFAVMPSALAERCIVAGCKPGGTVLDPFSGSGTTGLAASKHGRKYVGIDLNPEYLDLSLRTRLQQPSLFGDAS